MTANSINCFPAAFRFSHHAMATIFEIIIFHEDERYARQAAQEAFTEIDRLEQELSRFIENSDIARINNHAINESVPIGLPAFECLQQCAVLYQETSRAFDVTIGSLMNCWLNKDKSLRDPSKDDIILAQQHTGMHYLLLDEQQYSVQKTSPVQIDPGGIGKGYAVDQAARLLRDWDFDTFLIHGGTSSVLGVGAPPETGGWPVSLSNPFNHQKTVNRIFLKDLALSGSGLEKGQHIIDPRTGQPLNQKRAAWAIAPTAATSDALSTAFMVMTPDEINNYCLKNPGTMALLVIEGMKGATGSEQVLRFGQRPLINF